MTSHGVEPVVHPAALARTVPRVPGEGDLPRGDVGQRVLARKLRQRVVVEEDPANVDQSPPRVRIDFRHRAATDVEDRGNFEVGSMFQTTDLSVVGEIQLVPDVSLGQRRKPFGHGGEVDRTAVDVNRSIGRPIAAPTTPGTALDQGANKLDQWDPDYWRSVQVERLEAVDSVE